MTTFGHPAPSTGMTRDELLALPVVISLDTANRALAIGRSTGYALAKRDQYPVKVLRLGSAYRVITADLLRVLSIDSGTAVSTDPDLCA
ncbi:integrase [Streptomyces spiramenti]|uniref:Integrase n=1 Tax=Streptomyces spiramenti TaxID=2720606 RepID=A0ABX1AF40_9ACTN|nr:integrase [Streptomyces spiramenti]NJP64810.1 integrase [Streptomyces spiramenti]